MTNQQNTVHQIDENILNLVSGQAQYIAEHIAQDSDALFLWREYILRGCGIHPETGEYINNIQPNSLEHINILTAIIMSHKYQDKYINYTQALELSQKAVKQANTIYQEHNNSKTNNSSNLGNVLIQTDGASRGNPGRASIGWVIYNTQDNTIINEYGEYIGTQTNNYAEYMALLNVLTHIKEQNIQGQNLLCQLDSDLIVKQMKKIYRVKDAKLQVIYTQVSDLVKYIKDSKLFTQVSFEHIPRNQNSYADSLCNKALDNS